MTRAEELQENYPKQYKPKSRAGAVNPGRKVGYEMFDNLFNEKAIKELAAVLAKQDAQRTANETLREMDIKSIGLAEKIKEGIDKILI